MTHQPLADRLRPSCLGEVAGQAHLTDPDKPLAASLASGHLHSMILWGPPGSGKTTLARIIARQARAVWITLSAILSGVADIRKAIGTAEENRRHGKNTVLFVDEIHRFNKAQQDAFLPHMESGLVILIGATTENPSFALNNALLSRARVYVLKPLDENALMAVLERALADSDKGVSLPLSAPQKAALVRAADGDARRLLTLLEVLAGMHEPGCDSVNEDTLSRVLSGQNRRFDRYGDAFYEQISAVHKCVRSSNPDAALYWLARMLDGGCDPRYIARRLVRMATEDIGNADPRALGLCLNAWETWHRLGSPEGDLALAQAVVYLASCPKSNAVYSAFKQAQNDARQYGSLEVPMHLRNAPTELMKQQGYGQGYQYDHDQPGGVAFSQRGFPDKLGEKTYYHPKPSGLEIKIGQRLKEIRSKRHD